MKIRIRDLSIEISKEDAEKGLERFEKRIQFLKLFGIIFGYDKKIHPTTGTVRYFFKYLSVFRNIVYRVMLGRPIDETTRKHMQQVP